MTTAEIQNTPDETLDFDKPIRFVDDREIAVAEREDAAAKREAAIEKKEAELKIKELVLAGREESLAMQEMRMIEKIVEARMSTLSLQTAPPVPEKTTQFETTSPPPTFDMPTPATPEDDGIEIILNTPKESVQYPKVDVRRWKSILCVDYMNQRPCRYGDKCSYAHGTEDILPFLCNHFPNCTVPNCKYRHSIPDEIKDAARAIPTFEHKARRPTTFGQFINTSKRKTVMCRNFQNVGRCRLGAKCTFAHGIHELVRK